jgi:replicative DNA helicase
VIGAMLIDSRCVPDVAATLTADDFYDTLNQNIYEAMYVMHSAGEAIDPVTVIEQMRTRGTYTEDCEKYMSDVMRVTPTAANVLSYADIVKDRAVLRRLKAQAWDAIQNCENGMEMAATLMQISRDHTQGKTGKIHSMAELMNSMADIMFTGQAKRLDTGFKKLDYLLMGMRPGNLVILAARPGVGKSAFAQDIAENIAGRGKKVVIYSMEMKWDELSERWLSKTAKVPMDSIIQRKFSEDDVRSIVDGFQYLSKLPIYVCDEANVSPEKVRNDMINVDGLDLIIVDYVGLMEASGKKKGFENRNLELGQISRELKKLAVELNIPILMLCQLNREIDDETKPEMRHLRDSGELEQNANKIMFLWNFDKETKTVGVSVSKNRQGKTGVVQMVFDSEYMHFFEREQDIEPPSKSARSGGKRWED